MPPSTNRDPLASPTRVRTVADLARLAGVSAGTVSRALAGKSLVNRETRERIEALAAEHGFRPNQMASRLRTQRTNVIGVVFPLGHEQRQHLSDPFFMAILGHLADELTERGYDLMLSRVIPDAPDWLDRIVDAGLTDGVLVIGQSNQFEAIERVAGRYLPLVAWGAVRPGQRHCAVGTDNIMGGQFAGAHLIDRGSRSIAFMGDVRTPELRDRFHGVAAAMAEAGMSGEPLLLEVPLAPELMEARIAEELDRQTDRLDGIVAASDRIAMTAIRVLTDRGREVPDDVRVIGYDDLPIATRTVPRLTTIRQDIARGARIMTESLVARIGGTAVPSTVMAPELIVRGSA